MGMLVSGARFAVGADPDLAAWIALWDAPPQAAERQRLESLFAGIKADGCWAGLDVLHLGPPNIYGSQYNARKPRSDRQLGIQRSQFNDVRYVDGKGWYTTYGYAADGSDEYNESILLFDQFVPDMTSYAISSAAVGGVVLSGGEDEATANPGECRLVSYGPFNDTSITLSTNASAAEQANGAYAVNSDGAFGRNSKPASRRGSYSASREGSSLRLRHVQTNGAIFVQDNTLAPAGTIRRPTQARMLADVLGAWWCGGLTHDQAAALADRLRTYMVAKGLA